MNIGLLVALFGESIIDIDQFFDVPVGSGLCRPHGLEFCHQSIVCPNRDPLFSPWFPQGYRCPFVPRDQLNRSFLDTYIHMPSNVFSDTGPGPNSEFSPIYPFAMQMRLQTSKGAGMLIFRLPGEDEKAESVQFIQSQKPHPVTKTAAWMSFWGRRTSHVRVWRRATPT